MHGLGYWGITADARLEAKFLGQTRVQLADLIESLGMQIHYRTRQNHAQDIIDDQTLSHMTNAELLAWLKACVARLEELDRSERLALQRKKAEAMADRWYISEGAPFKGVLLKWEYPFPMTEQGRNTRSYYKRLAKINLDEEHVCDCCCGSGYESGYEPCGNCNGNGYIRDFPELPL